jgi:hypothetical protein
MSSRSRRNQIADICPKFPIVNDLRTQHCFLTIRDLPIFVPSALGRKWNPIFDSTDFTAQLQHAHLSDRSGHDGLQTFTKDSLAQHTRKLGQNVPECRDKQHG